MKIPIPFAVVAILLVLSIAVPGCRRAREEKGATPSDKTAKPDGGKPVNRKASRIKEENQDSGGKPAATAIDSNPGANAAAGEADAPAPQVGIGPGGLRPQIKLTDDQAAAEKESVAKIEGWGGKVRKSGNAFIQKMNPNVPVIAVDLYANQKVTDEDLAILANLSHLSSLHINATDIGDAGLAHIGKLRSLHTLMLGGNPITDDGLAHLAGLTELRDLYLPGTPVTGKGLVHLKGLSQLKKLSLEESAIDDDALAELANFKQLEDLSLGRGPGHTEGEGSKKGRFFDRGNIRITDAGLKHVKNLQQLKNLELLGAGITDAGLVNLDALSQLKFLSFVGTKVTDSGVEQLKQKLPGCKIVLLQQLAPSDEAK